MKNKNLIKMKVLANEANSFIEIYRLFGYTLINLEDAGNKKILMFQKSSLTIKEVNDDQKAFERALKPFPIVSSIVFGIGLIIVIIGQLLKNNIAILCLTIVGIITLSIGLFIILSWLLVRLSRKKIIASFIKKPQMVGGNNSLYNPTISEPTSASSVNPIGGNKEEKPPRKA